MKARLLRISAVFGVAALALAAIAFGISRASEPDDFTLAVLHDLLEWPPLATAAVLTLALTFKAQIRGVLDSLKTRPWRGRAPGVELEAGLAQQESPGGGLAEERPPGRSPAELQEELEALRAAGELSRRQQQELLDTAENFRKQTWYWHFEYLSVFLRPHTQAILKWLTNAPSQVPLSPQVLDTVVLPTNPAERVAVFNALESVSLVFRDGSGHYFVSPVAREFLQHMNQFHPHTGVVADPNPWYAPVAQSGVGGPPVNPAGRGSTVSSGGPAST